MEYISSRNQSEGEWDYLPGKTIYAHRGQLWIGQYSHRGGISRIELTPLSDDEKQQLKKLGVLKSYL